MTAALGCPERGYRFLTLRLRIPRLGDGIGRGYETPLHTNNVTFEMESKYCLVVTVIFQCRCSIGTAYNQDISISSQCSPDSLEKIREPMVFSCFQEDQE